MDLAGIVAGHFDLYLCRNYSVLLGREPDEVPALMKRGLVEKGVAKSSVIWAKGTATEAVEVALRTCRPGDLLVLCVTTRGLFDEWETIKAFGAAQSGEDSL
jgi:hypothetical protein